MWPPLVAPVLAVVMLPGLPSLARERESLLRIYEHASERTRRGGGFPFLHRSLVLDDRDSPYGKRLDEWRERGVPLVVDAGSKDSNGRLRLFDRIEGREMLSTEEDVLARLEEEFGRVEERVERLRGGHFG